MSQKSRAPEAWLTIREMAAASGLSEHTLRYYEKIGLIRPTARDDSSGHRRYDELTAATIDTLACLRTSGLSIDDMRRHLQLREQGDRVADEQKRLFESAIADIDAEQQRLAIRKTYLEGKVAYWAARAADDHDAADRIAAENRKIASRLH